MQRKRSTEDIATLKNGGPLSVQEELRLTRRAVVALAERSTFQKRVIIAICVLFLIGAIGAVGGFVYAQNERCRTLHVSIEKSRAANQAMVNAFGVLVDPADIEQRQELERFQDELNRQQREILADPEC